jgi:hypothetical protein
LDVDVDGVDVEELESLFVADSFAGFLSPSFFESLFDSLSPALVEEAALDRPPA